MQNDFEKVLASLDDQYQVSADIDRLTNALTEMLDYPAKYMAELDSQERALAALA